MRRILRWSSTLVAALALCHPSVRAWAAPGASSVDSRATARVVTVEVGPEVDGVLDDPVWQQAEPIGPMTQVEPVPGIAPLYATEIRLLTDLDNLYIGVRCWDADPDGIIARNMLRDGDVAGEDRISIIIDPFHDQRNGVLFQTNPLGLRRDGLIENARGLLAWNGIWNVKARIDDQGWTAEFVIPYKTLNFREGADTWGLNVLRGFRGTQRTDRWTNITQNRSFADMSQAGVMVGMSESRQGIGLDVTPAITLRRVDDMRTLSEESTRRHYTRFSPGGDARYKLTPSLTLTGTVNTDFGQTPVDDVRVNLSRFPLFFPERRDFFLQDQGIFEFADRTDDILPFYSRKIGLSEDEDDEVPIRGGGKVTGRMGPVTVGVLSAQVASQSHDDDSLDVDAKNLGVARVKLNVLEESTLGVIGTWGDPNSDNKHWLGGFDFNYRNSHFAGDKVLTATAWMQRSQCSGAPKDDPTLADACRNGNAFGATLAYPNDRIDWAVGHQTLEKGFDPALGRLRRGEIRRYWGRWRYRWRPETEVRTIDSGVFGSLLTSSENSSVQTVFTRWDAITVQTLVGDRFSAYVQPQFERINDAFNVFDDVVVDTGTYSFASAGVLLVASPSRALSGELDVNGGQFFGGHRVQVAPKVEWRPTRHLLFGASYTQIWAWLDPVDSALCAADEVTVKRCGANFTARIATGRFELQLSPDVSWNTLIQYENASNHLGFQSRVRWTITPGSDLFVILNQGFFAEDGVLKIGRTEPLVKLAWTFRF